ncbi:MAG: molybdopterin cofactor-binding domain-containing protein, partial [Thermoprotei archaeon]
TKFVSVHDSGKIINPKLTSSQVQGGIVQGLGYALSEGRIMNKKSGVVLNPNLADYIVPRSSDVSQLIVEFVEPDDSRANTIGAKGIGEPPIIGVAAAVLNAVTEAIGKKVNALPLTPGRLYSLINGDQEEELAETGFY